MFQISSFGKKIGKVTGIGELMNDIGDAMQKPGEVILMGGGNPAKIQEMQEVFHSLLNEVSDLNRFSKIISSYDSPQGNEDFLQDVAKYFQRTFGWNITRNTEEKRIATISRSFLVRTRSCSGNAAPFGETNRSLRFSRRTRSEVRRKRISASSSRRSYLCTPATQISVTSFWAASASTRTR